MVLGGGPQRKSCCLVVTVAIRQQTSEQLLVLNARSLWVSREPMVFFKHKDSQRRSCMRNEHERTMTGKCLQSSVNLCAARALILPPRAVLTWISLTSPVSLTCRLWAISRMQRI